MSLTSPLKMIKESFGGKDALLDKLAPLLERGEEEKEAFRKRLAKISNKKLIRLYQAMVEMNDKFGGKDKLIDAILTKMNRTKDSDFRAKLINYSPLRLLDRYHASARRS